MEKYKKAILAQQRYAQDKISKNTKFEEKLKAYDYFLSTSAGVVDVAIQDFDISNEEFDLISNFRNDIIREVRGKVIA